MYAELQHMLWELGKKNIIYTMDLWGPNKDLFIMGMRNLVLHTAPPSRFRSLVTIIAPI